MTMHYQILAGCTLAVLALTSGAFAKTTVHPVGTASGGPGRFMIMPNGVPGPQFPNTMDKYQEYETDEVEQQKEDAAKQLGKLPPPTPPGGRRVHTLRAMTATTSQFDAQSSCAGGGGCWNPSDDNAAVSSSQIVEVVNSAVAVYSRSGGLLKQTSASSFFNYTTAGLVDPNVEWDRLNNRWIVEYDGLQESGTNIQYVFLAVSQSADATAGWYTYQIRVDTAFGGNFVDYPRTSARPTPGS